VDPRQKRSRDALRAALISLMHEQDFDQITIAELTERADTAISTFYRHYANKTDLLRDILWSVREQIDAASSDQQMTFEFVLDLNQPPPGLALVEFIYADRVFFRRLLDIPQLSLLMDITLELVRDKVQTDTPHWDEHEVDLIAAMAVGHLYQWIRSDFAQPPAVFARLFHWMSVCGIMALRGELDAVQMPTPENLAQTPFGGPNNKKPPSS
jgi:AcrR family transcriptional regulator